MVNISQQDKQWRISGDLLIGCASAILSQSDAFVMDDVVEVDFSEVTDVDTSALSLIMQWQRRAANASCKVTFTHLPVNLISLAELYGVTDFIATDSGR